MVCHQVTLLDIYLRPVEKSGLSYRITTMQKSDFFIHAKCNLYCFHFHFSAAHSSFVSHINFTSHHSLIIYAIVD